MFFKSFGSVLLLRSGALLARCVLSSLLSYVDFINDAKSDCRTPFQKEACSSNNLLLDQNQAYRAISTGQLNALLRLHLRPIDVVVYHGPQGYLVSRGASRLDAFSGYPVRS